MKKIFIILMVMTSHSVLAKTYIINNQHSLISFRLDYMLVSKIVGNFEIFSGFFDYKNNKISKIKIEIDSTSLNTHNKTRDHHLATRQFLHSKKYPKIVFTGKEVEYKNNIPVGVYGTLKFKDITLDTYFDLDFKGISKDAWPTDKISIFLTAKAIIKREKFKLFWNKKLESGKYLIGDDIEIEFSVEANPSDTRHPFSRFFLPLKRDK